MKTKYIRKEKDYHLLSFEEWEKKYKPIEKNEGNKQAHILACGPKIKKALNFPKL